MSGDQLPSERRISVPDLEGEFYIDTLRRIHERLKPVTYFEIGCYSGDSLKLAKCPTIVVDPHFGKLENVFAGKAACHFFQTTSDQFYRCHDPRQILGNTIDFAFLDGMHLCEFALRDFTNTEKYCRRNSIIAVHDCLPVDVYIAERVYDRERQKRLSTKPGWWTGDVWKLLTIFKKYRPDLVIRALDCLPTGLALITCLDPESKVLSDNYYQICAEYSDLTLEEYGLDRYLSEVGPVSTRNFQTDDELAQLFWF